MKYNVNQRSCNTMTPSVNSISHTLGNLPQTAGNQKIAGNGCQENAIVPHEAVLRLRHSSCRNLAKGYLYIN